MAIVMNDDILLESGTNEMQIMQFSIDGVLYGINVAKVQQIMISEPVKFMPHTHEAVEGIFKPREEVITVINLPKYLGVDNYEPKPDDLFILTGFNKMGFMHTSGFMPAASACITWALPISSPSSVTNELRAIFWDLNGAARYPSCRITLHNPAARRLFPTPDIVP